MSTNMFSGLVEVRVKGVGARTASGQDIPKQSAVPYPGPESGLL